MIKKFTSCIILFAMLCCLFGCSAENVNKNDGFISNSPMDGMGSIEYEDDYIKEEPADTELSDTQDYLSSQKLIYTCRIDMQSTTFNETTSVIKNLIKKYDGFVESEKMSDDSYGWYYSNYEKTHATLRATFVIRIPTESYNAFLNEINGHGKIVSKSENVSNITKQYNETESTIKMLEKEEDMLLDMMSKCATISEMITVEERLSKVQQQLAIYKTNLSEMNSDIALSTITIQLEEVIEYTPDIIEKKSFIEEVFDAIIDSAKSFADTTGKFLIAIIYILPYGIIVTIIIILIILSVKRKKANSIKSNESESDECTKEKIN